ncbi:MAG: hypothetical protein COA52_04970 [Hyphomicrobiales bacterium]|nr:MAG: hypothetical protein COA52_04970 [Hyphomicrobiales bacterium]
MAELGSIVEKLRSKNAGPFWLTVDMFCGTPQAFETVRDGLSTKRVADAFGVKPQTIKRFEIPSLNVIKFSLPRPQIQGSIEDRDMHGASWAALLAEIDL